MQTTDKIIFANHAQLKRHPRNMRRSYDLRDVRQMAVSQAERAKRGEPCCVQPLIVSVGAGVQYDPARRYVYTIVAGHLRHAGNEYLGDKAPPLPCLVRYYATEADMLADMGTENGLRVDPGPLAWASYVQSRLADGVKLHEVIKQTGLTIERAKQLQTLLQLAPAVRDLIEAGDLQLALAVDLIRIEDADAQIELAQALARKHASILEAKRAVATMLGPRPIGRPPKNGAPDPAAKPARRPELPALDGVPDLPAATVENVREAAAKACAKCDYGRDFRAPEPAWHLARKAVGDVCRTCDLREFEHICKGCPLAQAMTELVRVVEPLGVKHAVR